MEIQNQDCLICSLKALKLIRDSKQNSLIDLNKVDKITPFFITPITAFLKENCDVKFVYPSSSFMKSYLNTLRFPECANSLNVNKMSYTPLYEIRSELGFDEENGEILDILEEIIIKKFDLNKSYQVLMSVFNELICNIQQHSKSKFNCIQAQMYGDKIAICLLDSGITIQNSYINDGFSREEDEMELFKLAFKGVSTKEEKERGTGIPNSYNWVCKALKGNLVIISKNCAFQKLSCDREIEFVNLKPLDLGFNGTIINILFEIPKEKIDIYEFMNKPVLG